MKYAITAAIAFLVGALACGLIVWSVLSASSSKLAGELSVANAELGSVRTSLANALASNVLSADANRLVREQLDRASALAASRQRTIDSQRGIIAGQQRDLDAAKRGLEQLAIDLSSGFDDIRGAAAAIRDGFAKLFAIYHTGAGGAPGG